MFKKLLLLFLFVFLLFVSVYAAEKIEVYDYNGMDGRYKINYTLLDSNNFTGKFLNITNQSNLAITYFTAATSCEAVGTNCFSVQVNGSVQTCVCIDYNEVISQITGKVNSTSWNRSGTNVILSNINDYVGIGKSSPSYTLDVNGTAHVSNDFAVNSDSFYVDSTNDFIGIGGTPDQYLTIYGDNTYNGILIRNKDNNNYRVFQIYLNNNYGMFGIRDNTEAVKIFYSTKPGLNTYFNTVASNFGIGTSTPKGKLSVAGSGVFGSTWASTVTPGTDEFLVEGDVGIGTATPQNALDVSGGEVIGSSYAGVNTAPTDGLLVEGNVGIGLISPNRPLEVTGTGSNPIVEINGDGRTLRLTAGSPYAEFYDDSPYSRVGWFGFGLNTDDFYFTNDQAEPIYFATNGFSNIRMTIDGTGLVGINTTTPQNTLNVVGDFNVTELAYFKNGTIYYQDPETEGNWRTQINESNDAFEFQRYENNTFVTKGSFGDSVTVDRVNIVGLSPAVVMSGGDISPLLNLIRDPTFAKGTEVGNTEGETYINTEDEIYMQKKVLGPFTVEVQNISNVTISTSSFSYNTTTPSQGEGYPFDGGINYQQRYNITNNTAPLQVYTAIYEYGNGEEIIWESSSYFDFTQGKGVEMYYNASQGLYEDTFEVGVTLESNTTYLIETYINESVQIGGTYIGGEFVPYLKPTGIAFIRYIMATYEFLDHNFVGTGNITMGHLLTFINGETIDNLVDGWLRVDGSLNVTGNITANEYYGGMGYNSDTYLTINIPAADTWTNITNLSSGLLNGFTFQNNSTLICQVAGVYSVDHEESYEDGVGNEYNFGIAINNEIVNKTKSHSVRNNAGDIAGGGGKWHVRLNVGDRINFQVINHNTGADVQLHQATLNVERIGN